MFFTAKLTEKFPSFIVFSDVRFQSPAPGCSAARAVIDPRSHSPTWQQRSFPQRDGLVRAIRWQIRYRAFPSRVSRRSVRLPATHQVRRVLTRRRAPLRKRIQRNLFFDSSIPRCPFPARDAPRGERTGRQRSRRRQKSERRARPVPECQRLRREPRQTLFPRPAKWTLRARGQLPTFRRCGERRELEAGKPWNPSGRWDELTYNDP